jgi:hypothetical protein
MRKYRGLAMAQGITDKAKIEEYAEKLYKEWELVSCRPHFASI